MVVKLSESSYLLLEKYASDFLSLPLLPLEVIVWTMYINLPTYCTLILDSNPMNSLRCHNFVVLNDF